MCGWWNYGASWIRDVTGGSHLTMRLHNLEPRAHANADPTAHTDCHPHSASDAAQHANPNADNSPDRNACAYSDTNAYANPDAAGDAGFGIDARANPARAIVQP